MASNQMASSEIRSRRPCSALLTTCTAWDHGSCERFCAWISEVSNACCTCKHGSGACLDCSSGSDNKHQPQEAGSDLGTR
jgi:hypothetical protein